MKRARPPPGKPFASERRLGRALELYNHEAGAEMLRAKLNAAPQPLDDEAKMKIYDGLKIHLAAIAHVDPTGTHGYKVPGETATVIANDPATAASLHLWVNDSLQHVPPQRKRLCRWLPGTFVVTYGNKATACGVCGMGIRIEGPPQRTSWDPKPCTRYWQQPTGQKLCKICVVDRLRQKLGADDAEIKRRHQVLRANKMEMLHKAEVRLGWVIDRLDEDSGREDTGGEEEDDTTAKKVKVEEVAVFYEHTRGPLV